MEGVDYTSRRHIGYHKNSKRQLVPQERSSSCPRYTSPYYINYKVPNKERGTGKEKEKEVLTQINSVINYFNHSNIHINSASFLLINDETRNTPSIEKENTLIRTENMKIKKLLSSKEENVRDADHSYDLFEQNVYLPLLLENKNLKKKWSKLMKQDIQDSSSHKHNNKVYFRKGIGGLMDKLKKEINAFNSICNNNDEDEAEMEEEEEEEEDDERNSGLNSKANRDKDTQLVNKEKENPMRSDENPQLYFEESSNITNVTDEDCKSKINMIVITEKYDGSENTKIKDKAQQYEKPLSKNSDKTTVQTSKKSNNANNNPASSITSNIRENKTQRILPKKGNQRRCINYP